MFTEIGSYITVTDPSPELLAWCKENLEMSNPEYQKKARMNLWLGNTPKKIVLYTVNGNKLTLPFGTLRSILPLLEGDWEQLYRKPVKVDYKASVPLYDYQEEPIVYDYVDYIRSLQKAYKKRCTSYRKCGCTIMEG